MSIASQQRMEGLQQRPTVSGHRGRLTMAELRLSVHYYNI